MKIPVLVTHFEKHRQQDSHLSFWNFLCMHYAHNVQKDQDHSEDMKLPFKSHDNCTSNSVFVSVLPASSILSLRPARRSYGESRVFPVYEEHFINSAYLSSIWQPPRAV